MPSRVSAPLASSSKEIPSSVRAATGFQPPSPHSSVRTGPGTGAVPIFSYADFERGSAGSIGRARDLRPASGSWP